MINWDSCLARSVRAARPPVSRSAIIELAYNRPGWLRARGNGAGQLPLPGRARQVDLKSPAASPAHLLPSSFLVRKEVLKPFYFVCLPRWTLPNPPLTAQPPNSKDFLDSFPYFHVGFYSVWMLGARVAVQTITSPPSQFTLFFQMDVNTPQMSHSVTLLLKWFRTLNLFVVLAHPLPLSLESLAVMVRIIIHIWCKKIFLNKNNAVYKL